MKHQRLIACIDDGDRCIGDSVFGTVPLAILVGVSPNKTLDPLPVSYVGSIADDPGKDIAGDSEPSFNGSDFNRLANLEWQDRNLKV